MIIEEIEPEVTPVRIAHRETEFLNEVLENNSFILYFPQAR